MRTRFLIGRTAVTLSLLSTTSPALASDFSGMIYYLLGAFLLGLAFMCAVGWAISLFFDDPTIKWIIRSLAVGGYLLFAFAALFGPAFGFGF